MLKVGRGVIKSAYVTEPDDAHDRDFCPIRESTSPGMEDDLKPRRPRWEEEAEIRDFEARSEAAADAKFLRELERPPVKLFS
ncbi:MAG: hypothetical protein ACTHK3_08800 [Solirubrobacterales bacterium]